MAHTFLRPGFRSFWPDSLKWAVVMLGVAVIGGCASSSQISAGLEPGPGDTEPIILSDYEDFDPDQFPDELPDTRAEIDHDVPAALLEDRADAGVAQIVSGYRIQVFSSIDRDAALEIEEYAKQWWENLSPDFKIEHDMPERLPIYNQFKQPLYRVRVGDFTMRSDAERIMTAMAGVFQTVFVVPDQVTVYR